MSKSYWNVLSLSLGGAAACAAFGCGSAPGEDISEQSAEIAATYQVGPGKPYASLQAVAPLLKPGDVVEVTGGRTYAGGVKFTAPGAASAPITIRGIAVNGARPVLSGGTNTVEFNADHYLFQGFDVTGGTSRCVFHHAGDITIRDSVIHDCPGHGVLGADEDSGSLTLEYSEIYRCGGGTNHHPIYMATDETAYPHSVFRMQFCYVHDGNGGNNVKSRAERNEIYYNWIEGATYRELELIGPDGQDEGIAREDSDVVGNVLYHRSSSPVIRAGGDGTGETWGRYRFVNNTIVSATGTTVFQLFDGIESIEAHNNGIDALSGAPKVLDDGDASWAAGRVVGGSQNWIETGSSLVPAEWSGTRTGSTPGFVNAGTHDFELVLNSPWKDAGTSTPTSPANHPFPSPLLLPKFQPPLHTRPLLGSNVPRPVLGAIDLGAYEQSGH